MERFYRVSDNSFETRGYPWALNILSGLSELGVCYSCAPEGVPIRQPQGVITVRLEPGVGTRWPDALGCGAWSLFIVSGRVLKHWKKDGIGEFPAEPVEIADPLPKKLRGSDKPDYYWLDGASMKGARLDFDASGFVGVRYCPECGRRTDDMSATYVRQHDGVWPMRFLDGSWNGAQLFTTDLSPYVFFCTQSVVECARRHRHKNFRFVPAERAASPGNGIRYL
jgi:hypothetical protein